MYLHVLLHKLCCLVHSDSLLSTAEELVVMYILRNTLQQLNTVLPINEIKNTGRDRMVVGFISTYAISACHHCCCELESRSGRGVQHYVIKFVTDLRQVDGFLQVLPFPPPIKLTVAI
jgi:hypothetical protein